VLEYYESASSSSQGEATSLVNVVSSEGNQIGSIGGTAYVSARVITCESSESSCIIQLTNTGTATAVISACAISGAGSAAVSPSGAEIAGGASLEVTCTASGGSGSTPGNMVLGSVTFVNGAVVPWSGTWQ